MRRDRDGRVIQRRHHQISTKKWAEIRAFYSTPISLIKTAQEFKIPIDKIKEHLIKAGIFRGREITAQHMKRSEVIRKEKPGKYAHLK